MRILFLASWFPYPPDNGSKLRVYYLLKALGTRHDVTLLSLAFGTAKPQEGEKELRDFCSDVKTVACNPLERSRSAQALRFLSSVPIVNRELSPMRELVQGTLATNTYQLAITSTKGMAEYAKHLPPGIIRVLEEHNSLSRQMWERFQRETHPVQRLRCWASWQKTRRYEAAVLRRHHLAIMVSEEDRRASISVLPDYAGRIEVVPNGVDCQHNQPGLATAEPNTLIFSGALTYGANLDAMRYFLADIYPLIKQQIPTIKLKITGSTQDVDLGSLALDASVELTGYVDDIRPTVTRSSVCVVPLRLGGGTRLKILEAMALGVPVVATSKGAEGLDVIDHEHLLLADSPTGFAAGVTGLLWTPALRMRLAANARRLVERRYDWMQIGTTFTEIIEDLVATNR